MSLTAATRDRLSAAEAVTPIAGDRVYRDMRIQGDPLPAAVIFLISGPRASIFGGGDQALRRSRLQIDCLAESQAAADALSEAVIAAMKGPEIVGPVSFSHAFVANVRGTSSREPGKPSVFGTSVDLFVWWRSAA